MPPLTCVHCGMYDGHFAGCASFAADRELERRRVEAAAAEQERVRQRAQLDRGLIENLHRQNDMMRQVLQPTRRAPYAMAVSRAHIVHQINVPGEDPIRCSCGWSVSQAYLEDMPNRDIRGMVDAHVAGGQVGPQQQQSPAWCPECGGPYILESRASGMRNCDNNHHWNRQGRIVAGPTVVNPNEKIGYKCAYPDCGHEFYIKAGHSPVCSRCKNDTRFKPVYPMAKVPWETPEISEPAMMPRRNFNLELDT